MSQRLRFSLTSLFLLPLFLVACQSSSIEKVESSPEAEVISEVAEEQPVVDNSFGDAVNKATAAAEAAQTAKTADEWNKVAELWGKAIELMKAVPEASEKYQTAQQKAIDYQPNLEYAQKNAKTQASSTSKETSSAPEPEVKPVSTESTAPSAGSKVLINLVNTSSDEINKLIPLAAQVADRGTLGDYTELDALGRGLVTMTILNSWIVDGKTTKSLTLEEEQAIITDLTLALSEAAKSYPDEPVFGAATTLAKVTNIIE